MYKTMIVQTQLWPVDMPEEKRERNDFINAAYQAGRKHYERRRRQRENEMKAYTHKKQRGGGA